MTYKYFIKEYIKPYVKEKDKPYNRQLFHDTKDFLHKGGLISDKQVNNWIYPKTIGKCKFE